MRREWVHSIDKVGMLFELGVEVVDDFASCRNINDVDIDIGLGDVFNGIMKPRST